MNRQLKITEIVKQISGKGTAPAMDESLFDSGYLDSFALTDMVAELEKAFSISIPDSDLNPRRFDSIERIDAYIASRIE